MSRLATSDHPVATPDRAAARQGSSRYAFLVSAIAALGGFLFGFDTAVIAGTIPFITGYFGLGEAGLGWAVSSVLVGCVVGAMFAGRLSDGFGRRPTLLVTAALFAASAVGTAVATGFGFFVASRILGGLAVGAASMIAPVYIAEIAPANLRGRLVSLNQLAVVTGILAAFFSNYLLVGIGSDSWRWMLGVEALPAVAFFLLLLIVPESPRWMARRDPEAALRILTRVQGPERAAAELASIRTALQGERRGRPGDLLDARFRPLLAVGVVLAVLQQVTGINVIMYYAPLILETTGLGADDALLQTVAIGAVNLAFTLVAIQFVDRLGRRPLLLGGSALMGLSLFLLAGAFYTDRTAGPLVLFAILAYIASFAASLGPVVWVVIAELFPVKLRGIAVSTATSALWMANFLVTLTFPWLLATLRGGHSFLLYALLCAVTFVFVWRRVPETRGKSLEQIEQELLGADFLASRDSPSAQRTP